MEDIMAIVMMEILWVRRSLEVECPLDHILNIDNVYTYTFGGFGGCFIYLLILFLSRLEWKRWKCIIINDNPVEIM